MLKDSTDILARTPGRRASGRCTISLTGVVCVLLTWPWTGSGHSFFLPSSRPFFTRPFLPLRELRTDIPRCDVTRGGVIGSTTHVRVWVHACPRCVPATKSFSRIAQRIESRSTASNREIHSYHDNEYVEMIQEFFRLRVSPINS